MYILLPRLHVPYLFLKTYSVDHTIGGVYFFNLITRILLPNMSGTLLSDFNTIYHLLFCKPQHLCALKLCIKLYPFMTA